jgi:hypothetical protein
MLWFFSKKDGKKLEEKTKESFDSVKKDFDAVGRWVKHLDRNDKQLFDLMYSLKQEIASIREEVEAMREGLDLVSEEEEDKQVFKNLPVLNRQTSVEEVEEVVQTPVQTDNVYGTLKGLSGNERLLVYTLMNNEMKLSYEDLALLLGKERSTVRGQINSIKQKRDGLIQEMVEKNGKKRVFIPDEIREKMRKYAKVRVGKESGGKIKRTFID